MKTRHLILAVTVAMLLTPVVLSVGMFILIPLGLVVAAVLPIAGLAGLPVVLLWIARDVPAAGLARAPAAPTVVYTRYTRTP